jgi:hypothetical protein
VAGPPDLPRYQFGPIERRGFVLGLSGGQVAVLASAGVLAVMGLRAVPGAAGGLLAAMMLLAGAAVAFLPAGGRTLEAWLPLLAAYAWRRLRRRHRFSARAHLTGHLALIREDGQVVEALPPNERPAHLRDLRILEIARPDEAPVGVIKDVRRHTYVGVLRVRGRSFNLLDEAGQVAAVQALAAILAGYALPSSPVSRLQWVERTLPEDGRAAVRHFEERSNSAAPEAARRVYEDALAEAREDAHRHECLLAVQVDARRSWRQVRRAGGGSLDAGAGALLVRELAMLAESLDAAGFAAVETLGPRAVAEVIRTGHEPDARPRLRVIHGDGPDAGPDPRGAWPHETVEHLSHYQAGPFSFHATYHVREWPRVEVGPGFLAALLLDGGSRRTVSMTLQPVPTARAMRELRSALASDVSDDRLHEKGGWLPSFRRGREHENVLRAERELADGHASYRFSGYVAVSAASLDELAAACAQVEQAASRSQMELELLAAQQERAFTYTLPLCEGLR